MNNADVRFVYFGGEPLGVPVADALLAAGFRPALVVCNPDRPQGRGQRLTPPPLKVWATAHGIDVFQPATLHDAAVRGHLTATPADVFVVVAYNSILPSIIIDHPTHGTVNVHPSLLPKLRGPSPIRTAILEDKREEIGVSIMLLDEKMDHGPLLAQMPLTIPDDEWPLSGSALDRRLASLGGSLLTTTLPLWLNGDIAPAPQDHAAATYTKKFAKADGEVTLDPEKLPRGFAARQLLHRIHAFDGFPGTFFIHNGQRIKITAAELADDGSLRLLRVIPEGRREIDFPTYLASLR